MEEQSCVKYLMHMADDVKCYGETNQDTKGGTWQVSFPLETEDLCVC